MITAGEASRRWQMSSAPSARQRAPGRDAANSSDPPECRARSSSAAKPRAISVHAAPRLFGVRVHEPRPGPAESRECSFASAQVDDGSARRRVELLLQHTHARNVEELSTAIESCTDLAIENCTLGGGDEPLV